MAAAAAAKTEARLNFIMGSQDWRGGSKIKAQNASIKKQWLRGEINTARAIIQDHLPQKNKRKIKYSFMQNRERDWDKKQ